MKIFPFFFAALPFFIFNSSSFAQVTNLTINDSTENFVFTSGNMLSVSYNIPPGDTASIQIWYDVNKNGIIDPSTDVLLVISSQIDGDTVGTYGAPDGDGKVNGAESLRLLAV